MLDVGRADDFGENHWMGLSQIDTAVRPAVRGPSTAKAWLRALEMTAPIVEQRVLPNVVQDLAERFGGAPALLSERECWTYRELAERSNRYARWALEQGVGQGDV